MVIVLSFVAVLNVCTYILVLIVQHLGVGVEKRDEKGAEESSVEGDAG